MKAVIAENRLTTVWFKRYFAVSSAFTTDSLVHWSVRPSAASVIIAAPFAETTSFIKISSSTRSVVTIISIKVTHRLILYHLYLKIAHPSDNEVAIMALSATPITVIPAEAMRSFLPAVLINVLSLGRGGTVIRLISSGAS